MHPEKNLSRVIGGKRYSVSTATLLASDLYWDGHNYERHGRNTFLYRTRGGAFFQATLTQWQGERDTILPLSREGAMELYEELPEHEVEYDQAFDAVIEEPVSGRPTYFGQPMKQASVFMTDEMIAWLKTQEGGMGETLRRLIAAAMTA